MDLFEKLTGKLRSEKIKEKRFADRRLCDIDASLYLEGFKDPIDCVIKDISVYGVRVESQRQLKKEDSVLIQVEKNKGIFTGRRFRSDTVKSKVVWARKKKNSPAFALGLKFADTRSNLRDSWVFLLLSLYGFKVNYDIQRRRSVRFPSSIRIRYNEPQGYYTGAGTLVDIGTGGIAMLTQTQIPDKVSLDLEWGPYGRLATMHIRGTVAWSGFSKRDKTPIAGVTFTELNSHQDRLLHKYIVAVVEDSAQK